MTQDHAHHGIILFAHGSRDPLWRAPMDAVTARVRELEPSAMVDCAFLELMTPDLPACAASQVERGARSVRIVPMFLGVGRHAREDLPEILDQLRRDHPGVTFTLQTAVGEDARVIDMLARIALAGN